MGFVTVVIVAVCVAAVPPAVVLLGKRLVDVVASAETQVVSAADYRPTIIALGLLMAGQRALSLLQGAQQQIFTQRVRRFADRVFLEKASNLDLAHFDDPTFHDRLSRAAGDLQHRPSQLTLGLITLVGSGVTLVGMLGILLSLHPVLVLLG